MKSYHVPYGLFGVKIIEHEGKYYSFGATPRSFQGLWEEVKDKLDTLVTCDFTEEDILEISQYQEVMCENV